MSGKHAITIMQFVMDFLQCICSFCCPSCCISLVHNCIQLMRGGGVIGLRLGLGHTTVLYIPVEIDPQIYIVGVL